MSQFVRSSLRNAVRTILLNRPERRNAMCQQMYKAIGDILNTDASNDKVSVTLITGTDPYFTSGNDLKAVLEEQHENTDEKINSVKNMISAFINYPKLIIAVVNGPAIGIGATMAGLCDIIYASERAVFDTPFVRLGLCTEGCSSYTFPNLLGRSKASEVLLLNHKLTAQEAYQFGFVSRVIPQEKLDNFMEELHQYGNISLNSLVRNKKLIMANMKNILCECNDRESEMLKECVESEEFANAIAAYFNTKSKL